MHGSRNKLLCRRRFKPHHQADGQRRPSQQIGADWLELTYFICCVQLRVEQTVIVAKPMLENGYPQNFANRHGQNHVCMVGFIFDMNHGQRKRERHVMAHVACQLFA